MQDLSRLTTAKLALAEDRTLKGQVAQTNDLRNDIDILEKGMVVLNLDIVEE